MKTLLLEWLEGRIPAGWKYALVRRWLATEMIAAGWTQDATDPKRLCHDSSASDYLGSHSQISMADHEAVSRHFKQYSLR